MKKIDFILAFTILACLVFPLFHFKGTQAIIDVSATVVGMIYLIVAFKFFRNKERKILNPILGIVLVIAAAFAILPLLFYFLNMVTFVININYNDVLFNYYKASLNSLIGFFIFLIVCITDVGLKFKITGDDKERRSYKILLFISTSIAIIVSIVITRKFGYHISFSRSLIKITLLASVFVILPYLFYSGLIKSKLFTTMLLVLILTFMNSSHPKYLFSSDFSGARWLVYNHPVRPPSKEGIDTLKTIESFHKIGTNFYEMTYTGDYTAILESNNKKCTEESVNAKRFCSLFTSLGDSSHYLFARNFDNPQGWKCKTLVCRTIPANGYASLSLVRLADIGFEVSDNIEDFSYEKKKPLINSVFYTPDGINEKGVVIALAFVNPQTLNEDPGKPYINCSYLVREVLDHAKNVEEAISIIKKYNIMNDVWSGSFDQHLLIADATGKSVIAEINKGAFQFTPNTTNWQAATNSPSYHIPLAEQKTACPRFNIISTAMEASKGKMSVNESMNILKEIGHQYTEWSAVYDISNREMTVVIDYDFSKLYTFSLKKDSITTTK